MAPRSRNGFALATHDLPSRTSILAADPGEPLSSDLESELVTLRKCRRSISATLAGEVPVEAVLLLVDRIPSQASLLSSLCGPNLTYLAVEQAVQRATRLHPAVASLQPSWCGNGLDGYLLDPGDLATLVQSPQRIYDLALGVIVVLESLSILIACETEDDETAAVWSDSSAKLLIDIENALTLSQAN